MESHKRILGIIYVVSGVLTALVMLFLNVVLTTIFSFVLGEADPHEIPVLELVFGLIQYIPAFLIIFIVIPALLAGIGLLNNKEWALTLALIVGCLQLFSFPIGTAIGIYTIWVYAENQRLKKMAKVAP